MPSAEVAGLLVALGAIITALVGWYTARNARKGQEDTHKLQKDSHQLADRTASVEEARTLTELSVGLVKSVTDELERVQLSLSTERKRREAEEQEVRNLRSELERAEERIDHLLEELRKAERDTQRMREEMTALSAELREYRTGVRSPDTRTRFTDTDGDNDELAT